MRKLLTLTKSEDQNQTEADVSNEAEGENEDVEGSTEGETYHVRVYEHYRTNIGSPSIYRRSYTQDEMKKFMGRCG